MNVNILKKISIRARLALAVNLLERVLAISNLNSIEIEALSVVIDTIKSFTNSVQLDEWHDKIEKLLPEYILQIEYDRLSNYLTREEYDALFLAYSNISEDLKELITTTAWVGISNIYGSTGEYSNTSLGYLTDVIEFCMKKEIKFNNKDYSNLLKYSFTKNKGWGETFIISE